MSENNIINKTTKRIFITFIILFILLFSLSLFAYWMIIKDYYNQYKNYKDCTSILGFNTTSVFMCAYIAFILALLLISIYILIEKKKRNAKIDYLKIGNVLNVASFVSCFAGGQLAFDISTIYNRFSQNLNHEWISEGKQICIYGTTTDFKTVLYALVIIVPVVVILNVLAFYVRKHVPNTDFNE